MESKRDQERKHHFSGKTTTKNSRQIVHVTFAVSSMSRAKNIHWVLLREPGGKEELMCQNSELRKQHKRCSFLSLSDDRVQPDRLILNFLREVETLCQINNFEFGPLGTRAFFQLDAASLSSHCDHGSFPEGGTARIYSAFCFLTCLTPCSNSSNMLSPQGAPEHKRVGKEPSKEEMKVFRGLSLLLNLNGLLRERGFKSCKVTFEASRDLDSFKYCTLSRPAGPVNGAGPTHQGVEGPFPVAQKPTHSP